MRSSCLRLRKERQAGPKQIQLNEFANQIDQYVSILGWNWKDNGSDMASFVQNTLRLLHKRESISSFFHLGNANCQDGEIDGENFIIDIEIKENTTEQVIKLNELIIKAIHKKNNERKCCQTHISLED